MGHVYQLFYWIEESSNSEELINKIKKNLEKIIEDFKLRDVLKESIDETSSSPSIERKRGDRQEEIMLYYNSANNKIVLEIPLFYFYSSEKTNIGEAILSFALELKKRLPIKKITDASKREVKDIKEKINEIKKTYKP